MSVDLCVGDSMFTCELTRGIVRKGKNFHFIYQALCITKPHLATSMLESPTQNRKSQYSSLLVLLVLNKLLNVVICQH